MNKQFLTVLWLGVALSTLFVGTSDARNYKNTILHTDSAAVRNEVMNIITKVVKASASFDINSVADLYTPNAVVADEEPPFSWNGPTAGVQWVSTVEKTCKEFKLKEFKGKIGRISVYL